MKAFACFTLTIVILLSGVAFSVDGYTVHAYEEVSRIITVDTIWAKVNSPYNLTGNLAIDEGATLTIEPGVTVYLNSYGILVNGTLTSRGTSEDNIYLIGGSIYFTQSSVSWNPQMETGCIIENTVLKTSVSSPVTSIMINNNTITNYINDGIGEGKYIDAGSSSIISKNVILTPFYDYNTKPPYGLGVSGNAQVIDNVIIGAFKNAAVTVGRGSPTIQRNLVSNDYGLGISISSDVGNPIVKENTITNCANGLLIDHSTPIIINNNIDDTNSYKLKMGLGSSMAVDASNNWWGTTNTSLIDQKIWDFNDDFNLGKVNYTPILTSPNLAAPPVPDSLLTPTPTPNSGAFPTTSQSPAATSLQSGTEGNLDWAQIATLVLAGFIGVMLVVVAVLLHRRSRKS